MSKIKSDQKLQATNISVKETHKQLSVLDRVILFLERKIKNSELKSNDIKRKLNNVDKGN